MKFALMSAALLLATGASAQETQEPAPAAEEQAAKLTIDTPIVDLMADEKAKAVVEKHIPGIDSHPAYDQFKGMSLPAIQPFSGGAITDAMLEAIAADLAALD